MLRKDERQRFLDLDPLDEDEIDEVIAWAIHMSRLNLPIVPGKRPVNFREETYTRLSRIERLCVRLICSGRDYGDGQTRPQSPQGGLLSAVISEFLESKKLCGSPDRESTRS